MSEAGTATTDSATATATTSAAPWYGSFDDESKGYLQLKGWDKSDAPTAASEILKAYRNAEKHIGAPPDQLLRLPKDANDAEGYARIYEKLGIPKDAAEYKFDGVKYTDGREPDEAFVAFVREASAKYHLNPTDAKSLASDVIKQLEHSEQQKAATYKLQYEQERAKLEQNWGRTNFAANKVTAENAALRLGVTREQIENLEKGIGYAATMEIFRKFGEATGEDKWMGGSRSEGSGVFTREQAVAKLAMLEKDSVWYEKFSKGDPLAQQEFHNLTQIIVGG